MLSKICHTILGISSSIYQKLAFIWMVLTLILSLMTPPSPVSNFSLTGIDKVAHFFIYFVLAFLLSGWISHPSQNHPIAHRATFSVLFVAIFYGITIEILQGAFFPARSFEISDIIANIIGCLAGVIFYNLIFSFSKP